MKLRPRFPYHQNETVVLMAHTLNTRAGFPTRFVRVLRPVFSASLSKHIPSHPKATEYKETTCDAYYSSHILTFIAVLYAPAPYTVNPQRSCIHFENRRPTPLLNVPTSFLYTLTSKPYPSAS